MTTKQTTTPAAELPAPETRTLIDAAAEHLPRPEWLGSLRSPSMHGDDAEHVYAVPPGWSLEHVDTEHLQDGPRRAKHAGHMTDMLSLVAYMARHASPSTVLWVDSDPARSHLQFKAVIDDHELHRAGWRDHSAAYKPRLSQEWEAWTKMNARAMKQSEFAAWIEDQLPDIADIEGLPTGQQMLEMALNFEAKQDMRFKSAVRLQSGGVNMEYVSTDDGATIERMRVFDRFSIGIPVYWGCARFRVDARLRYRTAEGKLQFWYELIRPARVAEAAATDLIDRLKAALAAAELPLTAPVFMGTM